MEKLHVLVVPSWYPNGVDKLMGKYHIDFAQSLAQDNRFKVNLLYIDRQGLSMIKSYLFSKKDYVEEFELFKTYGKKMLDLSRFGFDIQMKAYKKALFKAYKNYEKLNGKPDVLHAHVSIPSGYACCELSKKIGVPVIMTEHFSEFSKFFKDPYKKYNDVVMKHAKITCVSDFMTEEYRKNGIKAEVLPNVVNCKTFDKKRVNSNVPRFNIVSVCAMRPGKKLENIIEAIKILKKEIPFIHYSAIGDGELEDFYKQYAKNSGVNNSIKFLGRKNHNEIAEIFTEMDCMVISSEFETFGIPAVEALAAGLPVVSTKIHGPMMFLNNKCSVLCEVNNVNDLARAIKEMYDRLNEFDNDKLKEVAKRYDSKRVTELSYDYYKEITV